MRDVNINAVIDSDNNHIEDIIIMRPGDHKFIPQFGCNATQYVHANEFDGLEFEIRRNLIADSCKVDNIEINNKNMYINAHY